MLIGLEGGVAAGKSTLRRGLTSLGHFGLKEYMDYVDSSLHPNISTWPILFKTRFFLEIERARASELAEGQSFIDRTYLTLLAHDYARNDPRRFGKSYRRMYQRFSKHCLHPTKIVFLDASHVERTRRAEQRGIPMSGYFTSSEFNAGLRHYFERIASVLPVIFLNTDHFTPDEVLQSTLGFAELDNTSPPASILEHALDIAQEI